MNKVLITGANGQLGSEFKKLKNNYPEFIFYFKDKDLDINNKNKLEIFLQKNNINVILNTAAYTNVSKAELEKDKASLINTFGVKNIVELSEKYNIKLIHYSTDYVYSGKCRTPLDETQITNPLNHYGISKRKGELFIEKSSSESIIIRTSWLYSSYGKNFVNTVLEKGGGNKSIQVVSDQYGCPTYAKDLAIDTLKILKSKLKLDFDGKIYNYSNLGHTNWSNFAKKIIEFSNLKCEINEVSSTFFNDNVIRPKYSITNKIKIINNFNLKINTWEYSLSKYLNKKKC